jgi:hypothetical protein
MLRSSNKNQSSSDTKLSIHLIADSDFAKITNHNLLNIFIKSAISQSKSSIRTLLIIYMPALILLFITALIGIYYNIPISRFTRDPLAITGGHPFNGIISNIGIILWSSSVAFCFLSYLLLMKRKESFKVRGFIMLGGFISLVLLLDDLFMLHERIFPRYLGINEKILFPLYGMIILLYFFRYRTTIIKTEFIYLILAITLFALSFLVDGLPESILPMHHLFEDGAKFLGIISWVSYQFLVCFREVQSSANDLSTPKGINP